MLASKKYLIRFVLLLSILMLSACGGGSSGDSDDNAPKLDSISISSAATEASPKDSVQLEIIATYEDGTSENITEGVSWSVDDETLATISEAGVLKTLDYLGDVTVTATYNEVSETFVLAIKPGSDASIVSIELPSDVELSGLTSDQEVIVKASYSDGSIKKGLVVKVDDSTDSELRFAINGSVFVASTNGSRLVLLSPAPDAPENNAPSITSSPVVIAKEGEAYSYDVQATDIDGDDLTYELVSGPDGMSINSSNGLISWSPSSNQIGNHEVLVKVSDDSSPSLSVEQRYSISVEEVVVAAENQTPTISSEGETSAIEGELYRYEVKAIDPDGDALTYALTQSPLGMAIDSNTGVITWNPTSEDAGSRVRIKIAVTDNGAPAKTSTQTYSVTVSKANVSPVFSSNPVTVATVGHAYSYPVKATDSNSGDVLTYSLVSAPQGMSIDATTGSITWTPSAVTSANVEVKVTDNGVPAKSESQPFTIVVSDNSAPIATDDSQFTMQEDAVEALSISFNELTGNDSDSDKDTLSVTKTDNVINGTLTEIAGGVEFLPNADFSGIATFEYEVSDGFGGKATAVVSITVEAQNDAPVAGNDTINTNANQVVSVDVSELLANDSDIDGDAITISKVKAVSNISSIELVGTVITFNSLQSGTGVFHYDLSDGELTSKGEVTVNVNALPVAYADDLSVKEDTPLEFKYVDLIDNDEDSDGSKSALKVIAFTAVGGTSSDTIAENEAKDGVIYTPADNFSGVETFEYTIVDEYGGEDTGEVTITVKEVNDIPTISGSPATMAGVNNDYSFTPVAEDVEDAAEALVYSINDVDLASLGLSFDAQTGTLSGMPTAEGALTGIVITVTDTDGDSAALPAFNLQVVGQPVAPSIFPPNGQFTNDVVVTISGVDVRYTDDGSEPTIESSVYEGELSYSENVTIRAKSFLNGIAGEEVTASYAIYPSAGGRLGASYDIQASNNVNLSANGIIDWAYWGANSIYSYEHKGGVEPQIGEITYLVSDVERIENSAKQYLQPALLSSPSDSIFKWTDGAVVQEGQAATVPYIEMLNDGYSLSMPASNYPRRVNLYVSAFQATGRLTATLSDDSAVAYTTNIDSPDGVSHKVVTLTFAAASEDQTLTVKYVLNKQYNAAGNIAMRAATMTSPEYNARPFVATPTFTAEAGTYTDFTTVAIASDTPNATIYYSVDGSDAVEYTGPIGVGTSSVVTAYASKAGYFDSNLATANYTVNTSLGGTFSAFFTELTGAVNLTNEGDADWMHMGYGNVNDINRKSGFAEQLTYNIVPGSAVPTGFSFSSTDKVFSWTDGSPELEVAETTAGLYIEQVNSGFRITAPADSTSRQLNLYLGAFKAKGKVTATLSDGSVADYVGYLDSPAGKSHHYLAIDYSSQSDDAILTVEFVLDVKHDPEIGNVAIQAATLSGLVKVSTPVISPGGDVLFGNEPVTIESHTNGATIYYTLDGSEPTTASTEYTGPFTLPDTINPVEVKAIAVISGLSDSSTASTTYTVDWTTGCAGTPVRIMPLGDSVTMGTMTAGTPVDGYRIGYRLDLNDALVSAGYNFDFVGSQMDGQFVASFDTDHEGHGGYQANQIADNVENWLTDRPADYVLLHIGTNDISSGVSASDIAARVGSILRAIDKVSPNTRVILAKMINRATYSQVTSDANAAIAELALSYKDQGDRITIVDMENALDYDLEMYDGIHPNEDGYAKMANVWFNTLNTVLPTCN